MLRKSSATLSPEEIKRYQRQIVLSKIGIEGQESLKNARVLCVGAGGLGSPALLYLAAAGVGTLGIIDNDDVDITNLHRQILYSEKDTHTKKVLAAKKRLLSLNKHIQVISYEDSFSILNAETLMSQYDLVIDGTDNFGSKYLINDCAIKCNIPYIYGSVLGFEGRVMVIYGENGPCYRCLYPQPPEGYIPNCAEFGVLGALPGLVGCIQAMEAIKWIVNNKLGVAKSSFKSLLGVLWTIDTCTMETTRFTIKKNPNCPVCSPNSNELNLQALHAEHCDGISMTPMTVCEFKKHTQNPNTVLIDVRERSEWEERHIPNALHFPLSAINADHHLVKKLNPEKQYVLYCLSGKRSEMAAKIFIKQGIIHTKHLMGGISAWEEENE